MSNISNCSRSCNVDVHVCFDLGVLIERVTSGEFAFQEHKQVILVMLAIRENSVTAKALSLCNYVQFHLEANDEQKGACVKELA